MSGHSIHRLSLSLSLLLQLELYIPLETVTVVVVVAETKLVFNATILLTLVINICATIDTVRQIGSGWVGKMRRSEISSM